MNVHFHVPRRSSVESHEKACFRTDFTLVVGGSYKKRMPKPSHAFLWPELMNERQDVHVQWQFLQEGCRQSFCHPRGDQPGLATVVRVVFQHADAYNGVRCKSFNFNV